MRCCIVKGCRTRAGSQNGKSMFHMPALGSTSCRIWLEKLCVSKADFLKTKAHKRFVCSDHFDEDSFEINYERELLGTSKPRTLKPNATPLQQPVLPVVRKKSMRKPVDQRPRVRAVQPQKKRNYGGPSAVNVTCIYADPEHADVSTQTALSWCPDAVVDFCPERKDKTVEKTKIKQHHRHRQERSLQAESPSSCEDPQWPSLCILALIYALSDLS